MAEDSHPAPAHFLYANWIPTHHPFGQRVFDLVKSELSDRGREVKVDGVIKTVSRFIAMLWLRRIFERGRSNKEEERKAREEAQETTKLRLDNAEDWLKSQTADFFERVNANTISSYEEIRRLLERLETSSAAQEKAALDRDDKVADPRLEKIVLDNRAGLNSKTRVLVRKVKIPDDTDSGMALRFYDSILQELNRFVSTTARNLSVIGMLLPEQARTITKTVSSLQDAIVKAKKSLEAESDKILAIERTRSAVSDAHAAVLKICEEKEKIACLEKRLRYLEERKIVLEMEMSSFKEGSEWHTLQQRRASFEDTKASLAQTEHELSQTFSHINKALKKFMPHASGEGLDKSERKILDLFVEQPLLAIDADAELKTIMKILENTRRLLLSGKIELKERLRTRALAEIERLQATSALQDILQRRAVLKAREEGLRGELERSEAAKKITALEAEAVQTSSELAQTRSGLERTKQSLVGAEKVVQSKLDQLAAALFAVSGKKIEILMPDPSGSQRG